jgi:arsenical pump membrane protein
LIAHIEAFSVLALTVGLSLSRPQIGRVRIQPAGAAVMGALLMMALGHVRPGTLAFAGRILAVPVVTIVSLMIITLVAEHAGLFDLAAVRMARAARGSGFRLFAYVFACGTVAGILFTNDSAVLIFTPLVYRMVERLQGGEWTLRNKIPFYFAVLYVANVVGALVTSNPINIVVSGLFGIGFLEYARWMFLPALASIAVSFAGLALFFRGDVPRTFDAAAVAPAQYDRPAALFCSAVLAGTLLGFFTESWTGVPTWLVAAGGALAMLVLHGWRGQRVAPVIRGVSWDVLLFVAGIFVVVVGLRDAGLSEPIARMLARLSSMGSLPMTLGTSLLSAVCSALVNNHPTAYLMSWAVHDLQAPAMQTRLLAFSALIGGDLGPKMLPIGSLAALMWFRLLRARGVDVPYSLYVKIGVPVTLAAIVAAVLTLNLELLLFG